MLLMFEVEKASWFYQDFCREEDPSLPSLNMASFTRHLFTVSVLLYPFASSADSIVAKWQVFHALDTPRVLAHDGFSALVLCSSGFVASCSVNPPGLALFQNEQGTTMRLPRPVTSH